MPKNLKPAQAMACDVRIAFLISSFEPLVGGAERIVKNIGGALADHGASVDVITRHYAGLRRSQIAGGFRVRRFGLPLAGRVGALTYIAETLIWLFRNRAELSVVHSHSLDSPFLAGAFGSKLFDLPLVVTPHNDRLIKASGGSRIGRIRMRLFNSAADRVVALTDAIHEALCDAGVRPRGIVEIPNGVDIERLKPPEESTKRQLRANLGIPQDALVIVFVGRLISIKRPDLLLEAAGGLDVERSRKIVIVLVGDGPDRGRLERTAGHRAGKALVKFVGNTGDVASYLRAADVFVLPSASEGLSMALLEGMACGLCVIVSASPGNQSVVQNGANGLVFAVDKPEKLKDLLDSALGQPELRARLGAAARRTVETRYSLTSVVTQHLEMYKELASSG